MKPRSALVPAVIAAAAGMLTWFAASLLSGRREAWDAPMYWTLAYPAALMVCAWLGYQHPKRAWMWALILFLAQFIAMCIRNREIGSLAPLGLIVMALLSLPGMLAATLGAAARRKFGGEES
jgi:hypothetical protein